MKHVHEAIKEVFFDAVTSGVFDVLIHFLKNAYKKKTDIFKQIFISDFKCSMLVAKKLKIQNCRNRNH